MIRAIVINIFLFLLVTQTFSQENPDVIIIGGGASGVAAGIQAARMGVDVLVVEQTEWLGGMLTSAGVAAIDGNHQMPSGFWGEFRQKLYEHYGGPNEVETGWVSNTLFEPSIGNKIFKELAEKEESLNIWYKSNFVDAKRVGDQWEVQIRKGKRNKTVIGRLILDATELGDVYAQLGAGYDIGMDSRDETGEAEAPDQPNDIVQDLTYVVILKDFGKGVNRTIPKPEGYDPQEFNCACDVADPAGDGTPIIDCEQMITYGKLPNDKYMINWPKCGNDYYLNIIEATPEKREEALREAKLHTLRFVYHLQTALGFKNLGIAKEEFPTKDGLPMIPYHREARRLHGVVQLTLPYVADPYNQEQQLYRTGVAVGDYTIDHHHLKNSDAPEIDFVKIKVPSYNVPLGALIPKERDGLIVAEKSISVSNIVNGATRLQPVVLGIGQAAGALAAVSIKQGVQPREVNVREVQQALLDADAYLMPFIDVKHADKYFQAYQRIGSTGILKGTGIAYKWANQTWFYPDRAISQHELVSGLEDFYPEFPKTDASGAPLTLDFLVQVLRQVDKDITYRNITSGWKNLGFEAAIDKDLVLDRGMTAVLLDTFLNPFACSINFKGKLLTYK